MSRKVTDGSSFMTSTVGHAVGHSYQVREGVVNTSIKFYVRTRPWPRCRHAVRAKHVKLMGARRQS